jgi:GNAT superfamily N-acetyltransferase
VIEIKQASMELLNTADFNRIYDILIYAYAETEKEVWGENYVRILKDEFIELINRGEIFYATIDKKPVGSIYVYQKEKETYSFGLLSADFSLKGNGIGLSLVKYAEQYALKAGAKYMDLEILRPLAEEVPFKIVLKNWYTKLGYHYMMSGTFAELKPDKAYKAEGLIQPSTFDCYRKTLP